ncbi:MAG: DoxX family protein [Archangium sp.]
MTAITAETVPTRRFTFATIAPHVARVLLGGLFTFASIAYFVFPPPAELPPGNAGLFVSGLAAAGYLMPLVKITELIVGLALLSNRFVPLALIVLAPVSVNIFFTHAVLMREGLPAAIVIIALQLFLAWTHRRAYSLLFKAKAA